MCYPLDKEILVKEEEEKGVNLADLLVSLRKLLISEHG